MSVIIVLGGKEAKVTLQIITHRALENRGSTIMCVLLVAFRFCTAPVLHRTFFLLVFRLDVMFEIRYFTWKLKWCEKKIRFYEKKLLTSDWMACISFCVTRNVVDISEEIGVTDYIHWIWEESNPPVASSLYSRQCC